MLKHVVHSLGLVQNHSDKKSRRKKQLSLQYENSFVKIVHEGGQKELYQHAIPASKLMEKYPGMCVALPEVFRDPHQSVLWPEEILMPGHKYIIISCKAVEKLKRKYPEEDRTVLETKVAKEEEEEEDDDASEENKGKMDVWQEIFEVNKSVSPSREEAFCSVKEEKNMTHPRKKGIRGKTKPFVPPLPKAKPFRSLGWQPGLSPVQELSV